MHRNIISPCHAPGMNIGCRSIIFQKQTSKQTHSKKDQICGYQSQGGGLDKGSQKVQTSS